MPIIMTTHIANSSTRCVKSHVRVIIHADEPSIAPYISRAIGTIHAQQSPVVIISAPMMSHRSLSNTDSNEVRSVMQAASDFGPGPDMKVLLMYHAARAPVDASQMRVRA